MATTHPGSWFGLPDLGITEKIGSTLFGGSTTGQGGSDIFKNNPTQNQSWTDPRLNAQYNQDAAYQPGVNSPQVAAKYALTNKLSANSLTANDIQPINQLGGGGNALSQDALIQKYRDTGWTDINAILKDIEAGGGSKFDTGGGGGIDTSKNYTGINLVSLSQDPNSSDLWSEIFNAANSGNQSAIDIINSQYGQNENELNRQLGLTDQYQTNDLNTLGTQFTGVQNDVQSQRDTANKTVATETGKAADQARMTQKQNRNVLRALGILGSTYAAENLAAPINQFDRQKADLVNWGNEQLGKLDTYLTQKKDEYDNLVRDVQTKYGDLRTKILGDLRYNNQQKADALKAATAGAQQNIANLNLQKANYETQLNQYKQGLTTQIAQMLMQKAPTANLDQIAKQSIAFTNNLMGTNPQQVSIYDQNGEKRKLSAYGV